MILKRLVLENYCLFSGRHEFELEPRIKYGALRPIILFGGKNGAGKTTVLSAIQLAFYGRQSVGERLTEKEYHLNLCNRIHRNNESDRRASFAKVGLSFDLVTQGEKKEYYIERSWIAGQDMHLQEFFKVQCDGKDVSDMSSEHLQAFVADIVPERLSQLFFFDGEKIKSIAEDISSNVAISDAIQTLLGLDIVKSLQSDLATVRSRITKASDPKAYDAQIASIDAEIDRLDSMKASLFADEKHHQSGIDGIRIEIARLEKQLSQRGGTFAQLRELNINLESELMAKRSTLLADIRRECDSTVPFALCPTVSLRLARELDAERVLRSHRVLDTEVSALQAEILEAAQEHFKGDLLTKMSGFLRKELDRFRDSRRPSLSVELHALSERDAALTAEFLTHHAPASAQRLNTILNELATVEEELAVVQKDLQKTPEQLGLQSAFAELSARNQELGRTEEIRGKINDQLRQIGIDLAAREREKAKIEAGIGEAREVAHKTALIQKLNTALAAYMRRLTEAKVAQLQSEVTECYNRLARKADFVRRVEINSDSFAVSVIDRFGRSIPKENLSSGEKQIFAIAMLWGLARTSGRPLPVVIDTPLGRLDSDHRKNLIRNYFPHAGHQVILLSTDTEVDVDLFKELSPAVSHCYNLKYDDQAACTTFTNEYFWRETTSV